MVYGADDLAKRHLSDEWVNWRMTDMFSIPTTSGYHFVVFNELVNKIDMLYESCEYFMDV